MRWAVSLPPAGSPADLIACAREAEQAGWDGFFVWDHLTFSMHDPWVLLGAVAATTTRIRLGVMVTPLARRRPWKAAKEAVTLDHVSAGRAILGVGLGMPAAEFTAFGEPPPTGAALDEALTVFDSLVRGQHVAHRGDLFTVDAQLAPGPVQRPRPPIWVATTWPHRRPLARAARYDGVFALGPKAVGGLTPSQVASVRQVIGPGKDIVLPHDPAVPSAEYADAGVTWLIVGPSGPDDWLPALRRQLAAGPPRG